MAGEEMQSGFLWTKLHGYQVAMQEREGASIPQMCLGRKTAGGNLD